MKQPCQQLTRVLASLCDDVATPRSALVKELALKGEWLALQKLRVEPSDYTCPEKLFFDSLVTDFLRKADIDVAGVDREAAAIATFYSCEARNFRTNRRLEHFIPNLLLEDIRDDPIREFIAKWRKEVSGVLGRLPLYLTPRFGGGSTFSDKGKLITIPDKMTESPSVTTDAEFLCKSFLQGTAWERALIEGNRPISKVVPGNRFTTVPKDAVKHRGICVEPSLNVSFQLDVGRILKARLLGYGIDLVGGQELHRKAAKLASYEGDYATVDLSNASDTLSRRLVELILPKDWFELLDSLRSKKTLIKGRWVRLEKFSSMGNGFTFELETLVFITLIRTLMKCKGQNPEHSLCYGDDMIVPTTVVGDLMVLLDFFGFEPNANKTFLSGDFRESCGGDFFKGIPVRAHFIKDLPREPQDWIAISNGLRRAAHQGGAVRRRWAVIHRAWRMCLAAIPSDIRLCRGPSHLGDIVIHDDEEHWTKRVRPSSHKDGTCQLVRCYSPIVPSFGGEHWRPRVWLAAALYGIDSCGVSLRDHITGYRLSWVPFIGTSWLPDHKKKLVAVANASVRTHVLTY